MLAPALGGDEDESGDASGIDDLLISWADAAPAPEEEDLDLTGVGEVGAATGGPEAALSVGGVLKKAKDLGRKLDPRQLVRLATVRQMKDRAGTVGTKGVGPLLSDILIAASVRIHLVGHSYGGKVVLSAAATLPAGKQAESMLLLQPAVSHLCFAKDVDGKPGGYAAVPERVRLPISQPSAATTLRCESTSTSPSGGRKTSPRRRSPPATSPRAALPPSAATAHARAASSSSTCSTHRPATASRADAPRRHRRDADDRRPRRHQQRIDLGIRGRFVADGAVATDGAAAVDAVQAGIFRPAGMPLARRGCQ